MALRYAFVTLVSAGLASATTFCQDYAASQCADPFTGCDAAFAAMPAGDSNVMNDATEAGTQACVIRHLTLVDGADSVHCAHARGEGPCAAPTNTSSEGGDSAQDQTSSQSAVTQEEDTLGGGSGHGACTALMVVLLAVVSQSIGM